jgi:small conductance mechanosensitive channel
MSLPLQIILTVIISAIVIALIVFERIYVKKHEETIKKGMLFVFFLVSLIAFLAGAFGIVLIWNVNITVLLTQIWGDIVIFFTTSVPALIGTAVVVFVWILILQLSRIALKRIGDKPGPMQKRRKTISKVLLSIINYTLAIISFILSSPFGGVNVLPALAGLGIVGLVVGLGAQKFIQDLIAGFFIIFEHHYDVGDVIEVGGFKGTVVDIA